MAAIMVGSGQEQLYQIISITKKLLNASENSNQNNLIKQFIQVTKFFHSSYKIYTQLIEHVKNMLLIV